jgi:glycosyltransferase involved in cell wall biosynthesis
MYDPAVLLLSLIISVAVTLTLIDALAGGRRILDLRSVAPYDASTPPRAASGLRAGDKGPFVSIIVAARDEERGIERGVRSLLGLAYPAFEVIVVNDRSTDGTAAILDRVRHEHPRLVVVPVETLPPGWLGKNHALALGATKARGDLLLFTDADVVFEPSTLGRAVRVIEDQRLDHLTALPGVALNSVALTALVVTFSVLFTIYTRPWKARHPRSRHHIGVGAFNLIRTSAYDQIGTHAAIALRPDDDLRLARAVKQAGLLQDVVHARDFLVVEWYASVREMVDGLMKNAFAGIHYSVAALVASTVALVAFNLWPWVALFSTGGAARRLSAVAVLALSTLVFAHTRASRVSPLYVLLYPLGIVGFIYILWRSALLALTRGAIAWRGTSYPLEALKRARPAARLDRGSTPGVSAGPAG